METGLNPETEKLDTKGVYALLATLLSKKGLNDFIINCADRGIAVQIASELTASQSLLGSYSIKYQARIVTTLWHERDGWTYFEVSAESNTNPMTALFLALEQGILGNYRTSFRKKD